jgi:hypothetical protein
MRLLACISGVLFMRLSRSRTRGRDQHLARRLPGTSRVAFPCSSPLPLPTGRSYGNAQPRNPESGIPTRLAFADTRVLASLHSLLTEKFSAADARDEVQRRVEVED